MSWLIVLFVFVSSHYPPYTFCDFVPVWLQLFSCDYRDVAARNCLIGEQDIVKLCDFTKCSRLDSLSSPTHKFLIPLKWTAPEVMHAKDSKGKLLHDIPE